MITHEFVSQKPDRPDTDLMRPSDWNAEHKFSVPVSIGSFQTLTNVGSSYDSTNPSAGLGLALVPFTGVNRYRFGVVVNKIGSGTQSWQLWDHINLVELAVIDDAGAAGVKVLEVVVNDPGLTGLVLVRIRAKSTVAADDPLFYGGSLLLKRI